MSTNQNNYRQIYYPITSFNHKVSKINLKNIWLSSLISIHYLSTELLIIQINNFYCLFLLTYIMLFFWQFEDINLCTCCKLYFTCCTIYNLLFMTINMIRSLQIILIGYFFPIKHSLVQYSVSYITLTVINRDTNQLIGCEP